MTRDLVTTAVIVGSAGTALSVAVDSFFWSAWLATARDVSSATGVKATLERTLQALGFGRLWVWPELWGVLFNVVEGKSELWGVSFMWDLADHSADKGEDIAVVYVPRSIPAQDAAVRAPARLYCTA